MDLAVFSEIYIYGKYSEPRQSLSVFMGQREDMGQSPGNLGRGFGAWCSQGARAVGISLQQRIDLQVRSLPQPQLSEILSFIQRAHIVFVEYRIESIGFLYRLYRI